MPKTASARKPSSQADICSQKEHAGQARGRASKERSYSELAARLFMGSESRSVVAFAAVSRGEGVTQTVTGLAADLASGGKHVAVLDSNLRPVPGYAGASAERDVESVPILMETSLPSDQLATVRKMSVLRERYDAILLDCGSLEASLNLLYLAPTVDGVVLVTEAGRQSRQQIDRATDLISNAGGTFLGFVLNKRRYPIPGWLYRLL